MAGKPKHQQVTRFVDGRNPPGAKRKSDGEWHSFKEIISEKYKRMTLDLVMEEMKDEFQFEATYAYHRVGPRWLTDTRAEEGRWYTTWKNGV